MNTIDQIFGGWFFYRISRNSFTSIWRKRYCKLDKKKKLIEHFKNEKLNSRRVTVLFLNVETKFTTESFPDHPFCIVIKISNISHHLSAQSNEQRNKWLDELMTLFSSNQNIPQTIPIKRQRSQTLLPQTRNQTLIAQKGSTNTIDLKNEMASIEELLSQVSGIKIPEKNTNKTPKKKPIISRTRNKNNSVYLTPTIENNKKPIQTRRRAYTQRTTKRENSKTDGDNSNLSSRLQRLRNKKKEMEKKIKLENSLIKNNQQKDYSNSFTSMNFLLGPNSNRNSNLNKPTSTTTTTKTTTENPTPYSNLTTYITTTTTIKSKKDLNSPNNKIHNFNQNKNMSNNNNDNSNNDYNTSKRNQNTKNDRLKKKGFKLQKYSSDVSEEQKNTIDELLTLALLDLETTESNQQEVHKQNDIDQVDESEIMETKPISKFKPEENLLLHNKINETNINKNYNVKIKNTFHQNIKMENNRNNNQKNNNNKFKNNNIIENTNNRKFSSDHNGNPNYDDDDNLNDENNKNEKIKIANNTKENDYKNGISYEISDQSLKDTNSTNKGNQQNAANNSSIIKRKNDPQFSMSQDQFEILNFYNTFKIEKFQKQIKQIHKNNVLKKTQSDQNENQSNNNHNNNNLKNYKIINQSKRENILLKSEFKSLFRNLLKKTKNQKHIKVIFSSEKFYLGNLKEYFENGMLVSKVKPNGKLQQRLFYLSRDGKSLCWNDQKKKGKHVSIPFTKIEKIFLGRKTKNMKKVKKNINHNLCFSLIDSNNIFDFISVNIYIHKFWMKCLTAIKDNTKNGIDSFNI
ncbi:hypothetical protein M0813_25367 [Anaeramoeba flamelloides]|uniref:PH domain-containing protein n=1 Tax=Anaeramoeba flamelloides TaxID=1746091 RepID=A0ABQ8Y2T8_9EUKA|nr:hypothetical protein M0813_25367 [Anaeramoeba flamelloides]